jgi:hypothetical protein
VTETAGEDLLIRGVDKVMAILRNRNGHGCDIYSRHPQETQPQHDQGFIITAHDKTLLFRKN